MSSRKIRYKKADGSIVTEKFTFNKNKKYKFNKSTGAVEEFTGVPAEDEITIPGSKSSLRRLAEVERNISILASKAGVAGQSNADTDVLLKTGKAADSNLLDGLDSSAFLRSNANDTASGVITFSNDTGIKIYPVTNAVGAKITFSDHAGGSYAQNGTMEYVHSDTNSYGSGNAFKFYGTEPTMSFHVAGTGLFTGDVTAYYSDERLKDFSGKIENALDKVCALNGYHYTGNAAAGELGYDTEVQQVGVSAQEVQAVLPEVVKSAPINDDAGTDYMTVQYERLAPLFIEAMKEMSAKIESLEAELKELKK